MKNWILVLLLGLSPLVGWGIGSLYIASQEPAAKRSYYPAIDQFTDSDEKLIRWLDTDTGVICYARSKYHNVLSCVPLRAQRMP